MARPEGSDVVVIVSSGFAFCAPAVPASPAVPPIFVCCATARVASNKARIARRVFLIKFL